ncbi:hypothetical protein TNCV_1820901 [Trichonephila clavipes]|nr:hypothetical protein TNCV_1820901 [Trichonephila clavipes]
MHPIAPTIQMTRHVPSLQVMSQNDDDEYTLSMCVPHDAFKYVCDYLDYLSIRTPSIDVNRTIEDAPICDAASRVAAPMVSKLRVHATTNVIKTFVQTLFVVLKLTAILLTQCL